MENLMAHVPPPSPAEVPPASCLAKGWRAIKSLLNFFFKRPITFLWRNHDKINNYAQVGAIIAAGFWAYFTFFYTEEVKPAKEHPMVLLTATLEKVGRKTIREQGKTVTMIAVRAAVNAQNTSKARVTVMSAYFNARGDNVGPGQNGDKNAYSDYVKGLVAKSNEGQDTIVSRYDTPQGSEVIHSSNLMQGGWALDPGEQYSRSTIFYVPERKYDFLTIKFDVFVAKDPRYEEKLEVQWGAKDGELQTDFFVRRDEVPCDKNDPARNCDQYNPNNKSHVQLKEKYGIVHNDTISALSL
jgi:hypothetical protein